MDWHHIKLAGTAKKEAPSLEVRGAEVVSTTIDCIHIPHEMKRASNRSRANKKSPDYLEGR